MSSWKEIIPDMARDLEAWSDASSDMWTWLPSYALMRNHFGDYAYEYAPSMSEAMKQATEVLSLLRQVSDLVATGTPVILEVDSVVLDDLMMRDDILHALGDDADKYDFDRDFSLFKAWFKDNYGVEGIEFTK